MWQSFAKFKGFIFFFAVTALGGLGYQIFLIYSKMPLKRGKGPLIEKIFNSAFSGKYLHYSVADAAILAGIAGLTVIAAIAVSKWLREAYAALEKSLARERKLKDEKQNQEDGLQTEIRALEEKNQALRGDVEELKKEIMKVREEKGLNPEVKARLSEFSSRRKEAKEFRENSGIPIIETKKEESAGPFLFRPSLGTVTPVAENKKEENPKEKSLHDDLKDIVRETLKEIKTAEKKEEKPEPVEKLPVPAKERVPEPVPYQPYQPPQPANITIEQNVTNKSTCGTCFKWFVILSAIGAAANLIWWNMLLGRLFNH